MLDLALLHPLLVTLATVGILLVVLDACAAPRTKPVRVPVRIRADRRHF